MEKLMDFGKIGETELLDDNGSTVRIETNFREGKPIKPRRKYFEIRIRVTNRKEQDEACVRYFDELDNNERMLDPKWWLEDFELRKQKGYYYFVKAHTELEY